jgi:hypothetical protein
MDIDILKFNNEILNNIQLTSQEYLILKSFESFYHYNDNINIFYNIINSHSEISIRLIDYFVTKYSKTNKIILKNQYEQNNEQNTNIYISYKQQLKIYQKKYFDPFSRGDRIPYFIGDKCIITTIGQLNFFKWFFIKNVYTYIKNNQSLIETEMNNKKKNDKKELKFKKIKINNFYYNNKNLNKYINNNKFLLNKNIDKNIDKNIVSFSL